LHVEIIFLIHATAWDVEVPRASNGRAAEDLDADGNEDIGDLEGADGVGQASEDAIGIDAQIEEEDGELDEEGAEVVGCEGAEIDLQEYYYVVSGEVPEVDAITIGNCWRCNQWALLVFGKRHVQTSSNAENAHEKIFLIGVSGDFTPREEEIPGQ
jgi:hypothetical protein